MEPRIEPPRRAALEGALTTIRPFETEHAEALLDLRFRNEDFCAPYDPSSLVVPRTLAEQLERLDVERGDWDADRGYTFGIFPLGDGTLVGRVQLSHVMRGSLQNAELGYFVDEKANARGFATDAARLAVRFAFEHARLHRVQAGAMPRNTRSIRVLEKAGLRHEGRALNYLEVNGVWEDHEIFAITREEWAEASTPSG